MVVICFNRNYIIEIHSDASHSTTFHLQSVQRKKEEKIAKDKRAGQLRLVLITVWHLVVEKVWEVLTFFGHIALCSIGELGLITFNYSSILHYLRYRPPNNNKVLNHFLELLFFKIIKQLKRWLENWLRNSNSWAQISRPLFISACVLSLHPGESPSYTLTSGKHKRSLYRKKHSSKSPKTWVLFWTKIGGGHLPLMSMSSYPCEWTRGHGLDHPALTVEWGVHRQLDHSSCLFILQLLVY